MADWDELVERHSRLVFGVAFRIVGRIHDAEDVAQETFCEAFGLAARGGVTDWRGVLSRIATFRAIDAVRRRRSHGQLDERQTASGPEPAAQFEARELAEQLQNALPKLPRQVAAVFALTYFEQLSRDEVATALRMTPQAVSVSLFKARKHLERILRLHPDTKEVCRESPS